MTPKLWIPAPMALSGAILFTSDEIEAYERDILCNPAANEHDASRFFQSLPKFLHFGVGAEVRREVVLIGTKERVDFFRRSYGEAFWDIIELKHPNKKLVAEAESLHPRLSADVDKAINQAQDYRDLIDSNGDVRAELKRRGIAVCRPQITVVVGREEGDIDPEMLRTLYDRVRSRGAIDAKSYTDIYNFAKENYGRTKAIIIPSLHFATNDHVLADVRLQELIDSIAKNPDVLYSLPPQDFEGIVGLLVESQGFDVEMTALMKDGGKDIIAIQEGIGTTKVLIECKRYRNRIGVDVVRSMHGVVAAEGATKGIVVTTSDFSQDALEYLEENKFVLGGVDIKGLMRWIEEYKKRERGDVL
jgi:HJR/Mrr/RecB family endonuclease